MPALVWTVGLFVDESAETILATVARTGVSAVQLHGHESPELVAALKPLQVIKAIRVDGNLGEELERWRRAIEKLGLSNLAGLVMETASALAPGGTGVANDWAALAGHVRAGNFEGLPAMIAAGGLTPETVGAVIRDIRPYAVDVSSGVELMRREKAAEKIKAFVEAVREADNGRAGRA